MKLILLTFSCGMLIATVSSCTTTVEERGPYHAGLGGYSRTDTYYRPASHETRTYVSSRTSDHRDRDYHDRTDHRDTRVKAKVNAPLGISTGASVDVR